ncbi:MAG: hypothetical protein GY716_14690 [bacterium]|nr:hypothetical protein [bacterium]
MPVTRFQLVALGVIFLAIGLFWVLAKGREPFVKGKPEVTYRVAGGVLSAIGLLSLALSFVW